MVDSHTPPLATLPSPPSSVHPLLAPKTRPTVHIPHCTSSKVQAANTSRCSGPEVCKLYVVWVSPPSLFGWCQRSSGNLGFSPLPSGDEAVSLPVGSLEATGRAAARHSCPSHPGWHLQRPTESRTPAPRLAVIKNLSTWVRGKNLRTSGATTKDLTVEFQKERRKRRGQENTQRNNG